MDGVITSLAKEEGEVVIGAQSFQPTVIMTVADLSVMEAELLVDETDIRNVKLGQEAEVRVDALEGVKIKGEVTEIGSSAIARGERGRRPATSTDHTANQAKDFKVVVTLKDPPATLRPGSTPPPTSPPRARRRCWPCPSRRWSCADRQGGQGDRPRQPVQAAEQRADARRRASKLRGEGRRVRGDAGQAALQAGQDRHHGRDRHRDRWRALKEGEEIVTGSYKTLRTLKNEAASRSRRRRKARGT